MSDEAKRPRHHAALLVGLATPGSKVRARVCDVLEAVAEVERAAMLLHDATIADLARSVRTATMDAIGADMDVVEAGGLTFGEAQVDFLNAYKTPLGDTWWAALDARWGEVSAFAHQCEELALPGEDDAKTLSALEEVRTRAERLTAALSGVETEQRPRARGEFAALALDLRLLALRCERVESRERVDVLLERLGDHTI